MWKFPLELSKNTTSQNELHLYVKNKKQKSLHSLLISFTSFSKHFICCSMSEFTSEVGTLPLGFIRKYASNAVSVSLTFLKKTA